MLKAVSPTVLLKQIIRQGCVMTQEFFFSDATAQRWPGPPHACF